MKHLCLVFVLSLTYHASGLAQSSSNWLSDSQLEAANTTIKERAAAEARSLEQLRRSGALQEPTGKNVNRVESRQDASALPRAHDSLEVSTKRIDFGDDPATQLSRGIAALENLQVDGRECSTTLKVYASPNKEQLDLCLRFMARMVQGAEWTQTLEMLKALTGDDVFVRENNAAFVKSKRLVEAVAGYNDFAWTRLRTLTSR